MHQDKPSKLSRSGFSKFLVHNPFGGVVSKAEDPQAPECGYGAFHVQWWLGDHLVALCVVDVLPRCRPLASTHNIMWHHDSLVFLLLLLYNLRAITIGQVVRLDSVKVVTTCVPI